MTTYNWSTLTNGQTLTGFNPLADVLRFDVNTISAAGVTIGAPTATSTSFTFGTTTVSVPMNEFAITTSNVTFVNGTLLIVGDNSVGTGDNLGGTSNGTAG